MTRLTQQQLDAYRDKRKQFTPASADSAKLMNFFFSTTLKQKSPNSQAIPPPSADRLSNVSDGELRNVVTLSFLRVGIGQSVQATDSQGKSITLQAPPGNTDRPKGRQGAYQDLIFPFDSQKNRTGFCGDGDPENKKSSCGLFIRGMWQLLGAGEPSNLDEERQFRTEYKPNTVIEDIGALAAGYGARHVFHAQGLSTEKVPADAGATLKPGDVLFMHDDHPGVNTQHILTVAFSLIETTDDQQRKFGKRSWRLYSVDGGQAVLEKDNKCIAIKSNQRTLLFDGRDWMIGDKRVHWWVELSKMKASFSEPWILPYTP